MNENTVGYTSLYEKIKIEKVEELIKIFSYKHDLMILNSALTMPGYGQYSYICFDAFSSFLAKNKTFIWNNQPIDIDDPFDFINTQIDHYKIQKNDLLPPFQGGAVGYFGYEASHYLEALPYVPDNIKLPDIYLCFYNQVIAIDHASQEAWIICHEFPEKNQEAELINAQAKIQKIKEMINQNINIKNTCLNNLAKNLINKPVSNFSQKSYEKAVSQTRDYILCGDIFEANISQQFKAKIHEKVDPLALYLQLIQLNPAPFSAFIKIPDDGYIISASPERFVRLIDQTVETSPIKGTIKRSKNLNEDAALAKKLEKSEKDWAENIMIVDLMRNDFSKICMPSSVVVEELCVLKSFATVHHLVSKITGKLKPGLNAIDVLKATFPAGSITGAPKIRAMEIISELEMQARGPYCGCIGYLSFTGDMDTSVIIRTYFIKHDQIYFSAGGAVVLDSIPEEEYVESLVKAQALMDVLTL